MDQISARTQTNSPNWIVSLEDHYRFVSCKSQNIEGQIESNRINLDQLVVRLGTNFVLMHNQTLNPRAETLDLWKNWLFK